MDAAAKADNGELLIVCPFIQLNVIERLLSICSANVKVITRFNLADFASGVSDIAALCRLLESSAQVRGVRNLHAKLYIFGNRRTILTSANLTRAALHSNQEFGMVSDDAAIVEGCKAYFGHMWEKAGQDLLLQQVNDWQAIIADHHLSGSSSSKTDHLEDFGADLGIADPTPASLQMPVSEKPRAFVKLLGKSDNRMALDAPTIDELALVLQSRLLFVV